MLKLLIRLNDRLNVTEEQKTEITSMLFTFIKYIKTKVNLDKIEASDLTTWWIKYVVKPDWMNDKISKEIDFIAGVCEFFNTYKGQLLGKDVKEYPLQFREDTETKNIKEFLLNIQESKEINISKNFKDKSEMLKKIDKFFYVNNDHPDFSKFEKIVKSHPVN